MIRLRKNKHFISVKALKVN